MHFGKTRPAPFYLFLRKDKLLYHSRNNIVQKSNIYTSVDGAELLNVSIRRIRLFRRNVKVQPQYLFELVFFSDTDNILPRLI